MTRRKKEPIEGRNLVLLKQGQAMELPARCKGKARSTGEACKQAPKPGAEYCRWHGGGGMFKEKASIKYLQAQINGELIQAGWAPVTDPLKSYADLGGEILAFKDLARRRILDLQTWEVEDDKGAEATAATIQVYERALDRADRILASMLRIGLDAKALQHAIERPSREQAQTLTEVIGHILADPRVRVEAGQANAVVMDALRLLAAEPASKDPRDLRVAPEGRP